jgi:hypothetical protein
MFHLEIGIMTLQSTSLHMWYTFFGPSKVEMESKYIPP